MSQAAQKPEDQTQTPEEDTQTSGSPDGDLSFLFTAEAVPVIPDIKNRELKIERLLPAAMKKLQPGRPVPATAARVLTALAGDPDPQVRLEVSNRFGEIAGMGQSESYQDLGRAIANALIKSADGKTIDDLARYNRGYGEANYDGPWPQIFIRLYEQLPDVPGQDGDFVTEIEQSLMNKKLFHFESFDTVLSHWAQHRPALVEKNADLVCRYVVPKHDFPYDQIPVMAEHDSDLAFKISQKVSEATGCFSVDTVIALREVDAALADKIFVELVAPGQEDWRTNVLKWEANFTHYDQRKRLEKGVVKTRHLYDLYKINAEVTETLAPGVIESADCCMYLVEIAGEDPALAKEWARLHFDLESAEHDESMAKILPAVAAVNNDLAVKWREDIMESGHETAQLALLEICFKSLPDAELPNLPKIPPYRPGIDSADDHKKRDAKIKEKEAIIEDWKNRTVIPEAEDFVLNTIEMLATSSHVNVRQAVGKNLRRLTDDKVRKGYLATVHRIAARLSEEDEAPKVRTSMRNLNRKMTATHWLDPEELVMILERRAALEESEENEPEVEAGAQEKDEPPPPVAAGPQSLILP